MQRGRSLGSLTVFLLVIALATPGATPLAAQQDARSARLTLRNPTSDTITVETSLAADGECTVTAATRVRQQKVAPGRALGITASRPVCWRQVARGKTEMAEPRVWERFEPAAGPRVVVLP